MDQRRASAQLLREQAFQIALGAEAWAAEILRANPADLDHDADRILLKHHRSKGVRFSQIAVGYAYPDGNGIGGPLIGVGRYDLDRTTNMAECAFTVHDDFQNQGIGSRLGEQFAADCRAASTANGSTTSNRSRMPVPSRRRRSCRRACS